MNLVRFAGGLFFIAGMVITFSPHPWIGVVVAVIGLVILVNSGQ